MNAQFFVVEVGMSFHLVNARQDISIVNKEINQLFIKIWNADVTCIP